uniref:Uncharacterized protein n=1 Tax=Anguilla anguilla TaxID=7936 RepID=A0A0E9XD24_ANGAN
MGRHVVSGIGGRKNKNEKKKEKTQNPLSLGLYCVDM